jgi:hypothetical protein
VGHSPACRPLHQDDGIGRDDVSVKGEGMTAGAPDKKIINADLIAAGLAPFAPETAALQAGLGRLGLVRQCRGRTRDAGMGREPMTRQDLSKAKNPDLRASLAAMRRAADMARGTAIQTNTEIVIVKDGKPVRVTAEELRQERRAKKAS